jgi:hypothetical protein
MKQVLVYDINVFPDPETKLTPKKVFEIYKKERILLWDSRKATPGVDCRPKVYTLPEDLPITIIEVDSKEGIALLKTLKI